MTDNITKPTGASVEEFLMTVGDARHAEALVLIDIMQQITNEQPAMWGPSIIGFGSHHYKYDTGREGDMAVLGFSPRKAAITIYFSEGFDRYSELMKNLVHTKPVCRACMSTSLKISILIFSIRCLTNHSRLARRFLKNRIRLMSM